MNKPKSLYAKLLAAPFFVVACTAIFAACSILGKGLTAADEKHILSLFVVYGVAQAIAGLSWAMAGALEGDAREKEGLAVAGFMMTYGSLIYLLAAGSQYSRILSGQTAVSDVVDWIEFAAAAYLPSIAIPVFAAGLMYFVYLGSCVAVGD